ncbi:MAG: response regulator [Helicobacteraceae bacterium]|nr:response regulator [Helicobacteraceae bacterium]
MINILIVDDNKNNRMILHLLLEDYMEENDDVSFDIDEAEDGQIAIDKTNEKQYNLIFMDIMMPNVDGIEATKIIRSKNSTSIIIAVSAVDDIQRQKTILANGAEDYISKPINVNIFQSRLANYLLLLDSRSHKRLSSDNINSYTNAIFSRHMTFNITSEDSLSEFWEYYLLDSEEKYDGLSDIIRTIFSIGEVFIKKLKESVRVIVEESQEDIYFTIVNVEQVSEKLINLVLSRNSITKDYKIDNSNISFKLSKVASVESDMTVSENIIEKKPQNAEFQKNVDVKTDEEDDIFDF